MDQMMQLVLFGLWGFFLIYLFTYHMLFFIGFSTKCECWCYNAASRGDGHMAQTMLVALFGPWYVFLFFSINQLKDGLYHSFLRSRYQFHNRSRVIEFSSRSWIK